MSYYPPRRTRQFVCSPSSRKLLVAVAIYINATGAWATNLGDLAAKLAPGQWAVLNRDGDGSGFNSALLCAEGGASNEACGDTILNYAGEGSWYRAAGELHFIGKGHLRATKHISYSEATNSWKLEANPSWNCGVSSASCPSPVSIGHNFDGVTLNPGSGDLYVRGAGYSATPVFQWVRANKTWQALPKAPATAYTMAMEYFPELSGLVLMGGGYVYLLRDGAARWDRLATGLPMGKYGTVASYNPVHRVVMFGGGTSDQGASSRDFYRLDASAKVTAVASPPEAFAVQLSQLVVDPSSGRHILFTGGGGLYEYDVSGNYWRMVNGTLPTSASRPVAWTAVVPVDTYGVILLLAKHGFDDHRVHVYRHAVSNAPSVDSIPPATPGGLIVR